MSQTTASGSDSKLRIHGFGPLGTTCSSMSPFTAKMGVALRLAGLEYDFVAGNLLDKKVAPKGKLPVLQHGERLVPDTSAIFDYLHTTFPDKMAIFKPRDASSAALALALQRMLEEHTYFGALHLLWTEDEVAKEHVPKVMRAITPFDKMPILVPLLKGYFRSQLVRDIKGQGMGRHSAEEVLHRMALDLDACESLLEASGAYLTGPTPVAADCTLFGLVDEALHAWADHKAPWPYTKLYQERPALMAFHSRVKKRAFPSA